MCEANLIDQKNRVWNDSFLVHVQGHADIARANAAILIVDHGIFSLFLYP